MPCVEFGVPFVADKGSASIMQDKAAIWEAYLRACDGKRRWPHSHLNRFFVSVNLFKSPERPVNDPVGLVLDALSPDSEGRRVWTWKDVSQVVATRVSECESDYEATFITVVWEEPDLHALYRERGFYGTRAERLS